MDRATALNALEDANSDRRLDAARFLARSAQPSDEALIRQAYRGERNYWVRQVLAAAIRRSGASGEPRQLDYESGGTVASSPDGGATAATIIHEVDRLLGLIRLKAASEVRDFSSSQTSKYLDRLEDLLTALRRLGKAAGPGARTDFIAQTLVDEAIEAEKSTTVKIRSALSRDLVVFGDRTLLGLVLGNAVRNAVEATEALKSDPAEVVIAWGETDMDYWFAVIDDGVGMPADLKTLLDIGQSTKPGHPGLGLAIIKRACDSIPHSRFTISSTSAVGTRFEFRWPKPASSQ